MIKTVCAGKTDNGNRIKTAINRLMNALVLY